MSADRLVNQSPAPVAGSRPPEPAPNPEETPEGAVSSENLWRRLLRPQTFVSFAFAAAVLWFVVRQLNVDPGAIWAQMQRANPLYLGVAFILWYGAFIVRGWRWGFMISSSGIADEPGRRVPPLSDLAQIVLLAYFANSLAPAKLGDAYRAYLLRQDGGVPFSAGVGTIVAERIVDAMMLVVVLAGAVAVVFGGAMPEQASPTLALGAFVFCAGAAGLVLLWVARDVILRLLPSAFRQTYLRLQQALFGSLKRPLPVFGLSLLLWLNDGMRVWFVARSIDAGISPAVAILVAVMGALLTVIPFTPAGLGVVELGVGSILVNVLGVDPVVAGSIIVLDRVVAFWSLLLVGAVLSIWRARRDFSKPADAVPVTQS
ncbi:MAG: lysylphosphatidylglycerol synthase transmembrane domain-containing protein [Thermomicrobiales bacterium]